ncbi:MULTISPECIES: hypothetical protein [Actinoalloteichus]|uniref:hypothetical protein n=1 Tax=Actinoalloteichus TaxID=65496 RepID=UPI0012DFE3E8|nr:hypothetical protein [Actinoalloteichus caeruleus]
MVEVLAARHTWCAPSERIRLATPLGARLRFDVAGMDEHGAPRRGWLARTSGAVGGAAGGALLGLVDALSGNDNLSSDPGQVPTTLVTGPGPECLAVSTLSGVDTLAPGDHWFLTSTRLALLSFLPSGTEATGSTSGTPAEAGTGLLDRARRFGTGILGNGDPAAPPLRGSLPLATARVELPASRVRSVGVVARKQGGGSSGVPPHYLRVVLDDGSAFELAAPGRTEAAARRMLALASS